MSACTVKQMCGLGSRRKRSLLDFSAMRLYQPQESTSISGFAFSPYIIVQGSKLLSIFWVEINQKTSGNIASRAIARPEEFSETSQRRGPRSLPARIMTAVAPPTASKNDCLNSCASQKSDISLSKPRTQAQGWKANRGANGSVTHEVTPICH